MSGQSLTIPIGLRYRRYTVWTTIHTVIKLLYAAASAIINQFQA